MNRKNAFAITAVFLGILLSLAALTIFWPKQQISQMENRMLQPLPEFTLSSLRSGSWFEEIADYVQDHIFGRDVWIDAASFAETELLQKTEQRDILLGEDRRMFTKAFAVQPDTAQFDKNIRAISEFAGRWPGKVTFLLAPSADLIYQEALPDAAPQLDEAAILDRAFSSLEPVCTVIDLRDAFYAGKEEASLYFRTDHHWTLDGAYLAYLAFCESKDLQPFDPAAHSLREISDFRGTYYQASRWAKAAADPLRWYETDSEMRVYRVDGEMQYTLSSVSAPFHEEKLDTSDKYGAFLGGNNGYCELSGTGTGKILVIKDSYANCFVPFLTDNYETVGVMDLRSFSFCPDSTIRQLGYEDILILYSFHNFREDNHLIYLNRPSTLLDGGGN